MLHLFIYYFTLINYTQYTHFGTSVNHIVSTIEQSRTFEN